MENKRQRPDLAERNKKSATHGMSGNRTYGIWNNIRERCLNTKNKDFQNYGGRGITVCDRWKKSFICFLEDMGEAPRQMQIDRINNDKGYTKENCRWTTVQVQANNRRTCVMVTFNGKTKTIADWSREFGIERKTLEYRIRVGWDIEKALITPSLIKRK